MSNDPRSHGSGFHHEVGPEVYGPGALVAVSQFVSLGFQVVILAGIFGMRPGDFAGQMTQNAARLLPCTDCITATESLVNKKAARTACSSRFVDLSRRGIR